MKKYKVEYAERAIKSLRKLDKHTRNLIVAWIDKNLVNCENPRVHGKGLVQNKPDQWRYRVGDYRIICEIKETEIVILVLEVSRRREVYE